MKSALHANNSAGTSSKEYGTSGNRK